MLGHRWQNLREIDHPTQIKCVNTGKTRFDPPHLNPPPKKNKLLVNWNQGQCLAVFFYSRKSLLRLIGTLRSRTSIDSCLSLTKFTWGIYAVTYREFVVRDVPEIFCKGRRRSCEYAGWKSSFTLVVRHDRRFPVNVPGCMLKSVACWSTPL